MLYATLTRCVGSAGDVHETKAPSPRQRRLQKQKAKRVELRQEQQQNRVQQGQQPPPPPPPPASGGGTLELQCPHFAACSGCTLDAGLDTPPLLSQARTFFQQKCGFNDFQLSVGSAHGWRQRARLAVRAGPDGEAVIGLFEEATHKATAIPSCVVHHPAINEAVQLVQQAAASCGVEPYDEASGTGQLRYVQLTVVQPPKGAPAGAQPAVQLVLVWNGVPDSADSGVLAALAGSLWQAAGLAGAAGRGGSGSNSRQLLQSVWANYNEERTNTILGPTWKLLHGEEMAWARLGGADVCFGPGSFMQANFGEMDRCLSAMQQQVPAGSTVVDLHAGVGTIGLSLAATRQPRWVRFVEINGQGRAPFQRSVARLQQQQQQQQQQQGGHQPSAAAAGGEGPDSTTDASGGSSSSAPGGLEYHVAAAGSNPGRWCQGAEVVVCDPPRKGLEPQLLGWLCSPGTQAASGVRRLLYLSCGFPALQRDAAQLLGSGRWRLSHAEGFLFFPGTDHIETQAVFDAVP